MLDANTFVNQDVVKFLNENFISIKINAESKYGSKLFSDFSGTGYPLLLFLDAEKKEIDRFYGYLEADEFLNKIQSISRRENIFPNLVKRYNEGDNSAETMSALAKKYSDRGADSLAVKLYKQVINSKNVSLEMFHEAKFFISSYLLWIEGIIPMEQYIKEYPSSPKYKDAVNQIISYLTYNNQVEQELIYFNRYLEEFADDPWFLNRYSWRMTEINENLELALVQINIALNLLQDNEDGYANIIDTKAEILWKLGQSDEAIKWINKAIDIDSASQYYKKQKEKFINSNP